MARPTNIIIPIYRPTCCKECPLCGKRPPEEMTIPGDKFTHKCMKDGHLMSGRGLLTPDPRHRCTPHQWMEFYHQYQGKFPIHQSRVRRYQIEQQRIIYPPDNG